MFPGIVEYNYSMPQVFPIAETEALVYTVPTIPLGPLTNLGVSGYMIESIYVTNLGRQQGADEISIRVVESGGSPENKGVLAWLQPIEKSENVLKANIVINPGESIYVYSRKGTSAFQIFGKFVLGQAESASIQNEINRLKAKVIAGTDTAADKEDLMLLSDGAYVTQTNTNNCNCP